jgi:non-specific serine/threonine protein kinase
MFVPDALHYALKHPHRPASDGSAPISQRESQVIELIAQGMTNQQIAQRLRISVRTVETHIRNIREEHHLRSRAHLAAWSVRGREAGENVRLLPVARDDRRHP